MNSALPSTASRKTRSVRRATKAVRTIERVDAPSELAETAGIAREPSKPTKASAERSAPTSQVESPAACSNTGPHAVPATIATNVANSMAPLARDRRSCETS